MGEIIDIEGHRETVVLAIETLNGEVHLIPEMAIRAIINGERSITSLYNWEEIVKVILQNELDYINGETEWQ